MKKKSKPKFRTSERILIDFDGVVHKYRKGWNDGIPYDSPMENSKEAIKRLLDKGFEVMIFTAYNPSFKNRNIEIKKWLKKWHFPDLKVTSTKYSAIAIIDDRAIRFTNWKDIMKYFM